MSIFDRLIEWKVAVILLVGLQLSGSEPHAAVDAPCTHSNASTCPWVRLQQQVILQSKLNEGWLVLLDLPKALDTINHHVLISKL